MTFFVIFINLFSLMLIRTREKINLKTHEYMKDKCDYLIRQLYDDYTYL